MLTNENDVNTVRAESTKIFWSTDSRLTHKYARIVEHFREPHRMLERRLHRAKITVVDPE